MLISVDAKCTHALNKSLDGQTMNIAVHDLHSQLGDACGLIAANTRPECSMNANEQYLIV